jgi:hypothetical protein
MWIRKISRVAFAAVLANGLSCEREPSSRSENRDQTAVSHAADRSDLAPSIQGERDAASDIAAGRWRYFHIGEPLRDDSPYIGILRSRYQVSVEQEGCSPVPPRAAYVKAYNNRMLRALTERFGLDPIRAAADDAAKRGGF